MQVNLCKANLHTLLITKERRKNENTHKNIIWN